MPPWHRGVSVMVKREEPKKHMFNRKHQLGAVIVMLTLCVIVASPLWGQGRGFGPAAAAAQSTRDPLAFLKQALSKAGATALTSDQETALNTLITNFRSANKPTQDPNEQAIRDQYANAILAGNLSTASSYADKLATLLSARQSTMLKAEADFQIQALHILTSGQVGALETSVGNNGILRVLQSLTRPGPGFGRGMMGGPATMGARGQIRPPNRK